MLVCRYPENKSFEIPSPIFRMSVGDLDLFGVDFRFVSAAYTETGGVNMDVMRTELGRQGIQLLSY